jgi:DNA-binding beta-propeller fold protein YncE
MSGTPTAVAAAASYTVTGYGSIGSTTTTLTITVVDKAPAALSYAAGTAAYTINVPITPNFPTNSGGTVASYSVVPALPTGLSLNTSTGVISGTPTALFTSAKYTVTATNSGGSTTGTVTIAVNAVPSTAVAAPAGLAYHPSNAVYTVGAPIPDNWPTSTGGPPVSFINSGVPVPGYSISPPLPDGLNLSGTAATLADNGTGVISGTPLNPSAQQTYTVTASNSSGSTTAQLTITVNPAGVSPSGLAYDTPAPVYVAGVQIPSNSPVKNTTIPTGSTYSVSPNLPAGLSFDTSTGAVSGTPAAVPSTIVPPPDPTIYPPPPFTATYTVTVTSPTGSTTAPLTITLYNPLQAIPNMAQMITPLETLGATFQYLDTGMVVTDSFNPAVPPREWLAGQAVSTSVSPDYQTLAVLTSGYNRIFQGAFPLFDPLYSSEYIFIFDISSGTPVFKQSIPVPNTYHGIVWDPNPSNQAFYVSGGMGDAPFGTDPIPNSKNKFNFYVVPNGDNVHIVTQTGGVWGLTAELQLGQDSRNLLPPITTPPPYPVVQGHLSGNGLPVPNNSIASVNSAVFVAPMAAGIGVSKDGNFLVVANYFNDSVTIFQGGLSAWLAQWVKDTDASNPASTQYGHGTMQGTELDLRPGQAASSPSPGTPGGEYPFWVVMAGSGTGTKAYVSSIRDREIDVVSLYACKGYPPQCTYDPSVTARIPVKGQPNKMTINKAETLLYVAEDQSDTVDVIDINPANTGGPGQTIPATVNTVIESIPVIAPPDRLAAFSLTQFTGANTNSVTLSPDESQLYVTNGNLNNIAVVQLNQTNHGDKVIGLIPTGWYPNSISFNQDGSWAYVVNMKSPTGANPDECYAYGPAGYPSCMPAGEYNPQLTKAGLLSIPIASVTAKLSDLTTRVEKNNRFAATSNTGPVISAVHQGIQHVIYILKENRTYDQILGDLGRGNGDPSLTLFGQEITPNQHNLAQTFVTLDNF